MLNLDGEELEQGLIYGRTGINVAQGAYLGITRTLHAKEKILLWNFFALYLLDTPIVCAKELQKNYFPKMFHGRSTRIRMHTSSTVGLHPIMILDLFWQAPHKKSCANQEKRYESLPSVSEVVLGNSSTFRADICSREYDKSNQQEQKAQILKIKKLFLFASGLSIFKIFICHKSLIHRFTVGRQLARFTKNYITRLDGEINMAQRSVACTATSVHLGVMV